MRSMITSTLRSSRHRWASKLLLVCLTVNAANAGMISTAQIDIHNSVENEQQLVHTTLLREDVKQALLAHGVDPDHVQQRVNQLTDQEIQQLAQRFNELPAASGVGLVLFATGPIVFMLELMGYTDLTTTF